MWQQQWSFSLHGYKIYVGEEVPGLLQLLWRFVWFDEGFPWSTSLLLLLLLLLKSHLTLLLLPLKLLLDTFLLLEPNQSCLNHLQGEW